MLCTTFKIKRLTILGKIYLKSAVVRKNISEKDDIKLHPVSAVFLNGNSGLESRSKGVIQETLKKRIQIMKKRHTEYTPDSHQPSVC